MTDLFGYQPAFEQRYPNAPGHRGVDTSRAAAEALKPALGRLQSIVLEAIRHSGAHGLTAHETAAFTRIVREAIQPRITELVLKGLVRDSGRRRENASGKSARVWVSVDG